MQQRGPSMLDSRSSPLFAGLAGLAGTELEVLITTTAASNQRHLTLTPTIVINRAQSRFQMQFKIRRGRSGRGGTGAEASEALGQSHLRDATATATATAEADKQKSGNRSRRGGNTKALWNKAGTKQRGSQRH